MASNKFIERLKGESTRKSVLEVKNEATKTSFANMPSGSSDALRVYDDARGNATAVLKGTEIWKLQNNQLIAVTNAYGDGRDFTSTYTVSGNTTWVNAVYTLDRKMLFTGATKWVLKLCGHSLLSEGANTINFSLLIKFNNSPIITKSFTVKESAFEFCKEFIIDFNESEQTAIKMAEADTITVQLLCADATASATIYNGMTTLVAQQRRVDGEAVASDLHTFEDLEVEVADIADDLADHIANKNNPHEVTKAQVGLGNCDNTSDLDKPVSTATQTALDRKVSTDGSSIMTGPLKMRATSSFQCAIAPFWDGVGFYKLNNDDSVTLIASIETPDGFVPWVTNTYNIGSSLKKWKNLYLTGKAYMSVINNGYDIAVPVTNSADTLALKSEVDLAANSGSQLYTTGVWYAKMYAATVVPTGAEYDGRNYADFSQVDSENNPVIKIYTGASGAWILTETITPPATYNGYMTITSKIWDIAEQSGQQGGQVLWDYTHKTFTPYPRIVSFESINITGNSTVIMPATPTDNSIPNKKYVDDLVTNSGTGRNVGDIFFTARKDSSLNGAVECNGGTYNTTDFTGAQSIGDLLADGKVPYVSLSQYATLLSTNGSVGVFGWDGGSTTTFRVPSLNDIFVETGTSSQIGDFIPAGLPDHNHTVSAYNNNNDGYASVFMAEWGNQITTLTTSNASASNSIYGNSNTVQPKSVRYRAMVQLVVSATDEAVATCTQVLSDVATMKSHEVIAFQAPTADNNYTWYRKYADGWVEQGGVSSANATVTLPIQMQDVDYTVTACALGTTVLSVGINRVNTTSIYINTSAQVASWQVSGMAAN